MSFSERKNTKDGMAAGQKASVDNIYEWMQRIRQ